MSFWLIAGGILGTLGFNVSVDVGSLDGFITEAFRWIFGNGGGVFCPIVVG